MFGWLVRASVVVRWVRLLIGTSVGPLPLVRPGRAGRTGLGVVGRLVTQRRSAWGDRVGLDG